MRRTAHQPLGPASQPLPTGSFGLGIPAPSFWVSAWVGFLLASDTLGIQWPGHRRGPVLRAGLRRTHALSQEGVLSREEAAGPREPWGPAADHTASTALGPGPVGAWHLDGRLLVRKQRSRQGQPRIVLERSQLRACPGAAGPDPPRAAWARGSVSSMGTVQRASDLRGR